MLFCPVGGGGMEDLYALGLSFCPRGGVLVIFK